MSLSRALRALEAQAAIFRATCSVFGLPPVRGRGEYAAGWRDARLAALRALTDLSDEVRAEGADATREEESNA